MFISWKIHFKLKEGLSSYLITDIKLIGASVVILPKKWYNCTFTCISLKDNRTYMKMYWLLKLILLEIQIYLLSEPKFTNINFF